MRNERGRTWRRRALAILLPFIVVGVVTVGFLSSTGASIAENPLFGPPTGASTNARVTLQITVNHQEQGSVDLIWLVQMAFRGQFWRPSCLLFCGRGVSYYLDPAPIITNEGRDLEQCRIFGTAGTITCSNVGSTDYPSIIYLSTSSNSPSATDTQAGGSGPCVTGLITTGGLADVAGTVTPGAQGATVTTVIGKTFTAAETDSGVQASCLKTELHTGSHIYLYAEGTFGPDSLVSGNQIQITWSISRS